MNNLNNDLLKNSSKNTQNDYKEFYLTKDSGKYLIILQKSENKIIMRIETYEIRLEFNEFQKLINNYEFKSIENIFSFVIESFERDEIYIKDIEINKSIKLVFQSNKINNKVKKAEIILIQKNLNKDFIINDLYQKNIQLKEDISEIIAQNKKMKNELLKYQLKKNNKDNNIINKTISLSLDNNKSIYSSPIYIQYYKNISTDSYAHFSLDNTFILVKSIFDINYIIYSTKTKSIISQDIMKFKKVTEIKNAHDNYITYFSHFLDKINRRDIIMSISAEDNNIKLWDLKNWICLSDLKNINSHGSLFSACFFHDKNENKNFIITSNDNYSHSENIKKLDFEGNKIKEIEGSNHRTYTMNIFYDKNLDKYFIVTGIEKGVISYDYQEFKIYKQYIEKNDDLFLDDHDSIIIIQEKEFVKVIESSEDGCIRIWDFHSANLLNKIEVCESKLHGICLWNKKFLFVGCDDTTLKLLDLEKNFLVNNIKTEGYIINAKKMYHNEYKECLITQDWRNQIKIWTIKN